MTAESSMNGSSETMSAEGMIYLRVFWQFDLDDLLDVPLSTFQRFPVVVEMIDLAHMKSRRARSSWSEAS
jgi:hypothetical protein